MFCCGENDQPWLHLLRCWNPCPPVQLSSDQLSLQGKNKSIMLSNQMSPMTCLPISSALPLPHPQSPWQLHNITTPSPWQPLSPSSPRRARDATNMTALEQPVRLWPLPLPLLIRSPFIPSLLGVKTSKSGRSFSHPATLIKATLYPNGSTRLRNPLPSATGIKRICRIAAVVATQQPTAASVSPTLLYPGGNWSPLASCWKVPWLVGVIQSLPYY